MDRRCPRKLKTLPKKPCERGRRKAVSMTSTRSNIEDIGDGECVWYINDVKYNYCFFSYMLDPKNYGNTMTLREISELFGTSINNIKLRETEAFENFNRHWQGFDV